MSADITSEDIDVVMGAIAQIRAMRKPGRWDAARDTLAMLKIKSPRIYDQIREEAIAVLIAQAEYRR